MQALGDLGASAEELATANAEKDICQTMNANTVPAQKCEQGRLRTGAANPIGLTGNEQLGVCKALRSEC